MVAARRCSFSVQKSINAPLDVVWSIVRQFNNPEGYKAFIDSCTIDNITGFRVITYTSAFPSKMSVERLDHLDDDSHFMMFSVVGGDHADRLANYQGTISVFEVDIDNSYNNTKTIVIEKSTVDVPNGRNLEDIEVFLDTLVGLNLMSLAYKAEAMVAGRE